MNIELYIANRLCDLEKSDLSIKLKRQFFSPTELNTKDAQKSYTITLPSTPTNDSIFGYKNVEETDGKFTIYPDAKLYVNGILILEGKFRLSEITRHSYKGNLGVPAPLTVKDVFGEMKMNQAGMWPLDYQNVAAISHWNNEPNPPAFFPLVLYGLLNSTNQQNKLTIDENTKFSIEDFPPSVNCIEMLKKIFANASYTLTGTATTDERLSKLYVSYRNPNDYVMPFSFKKAVIRGRWSNYLDGKVETKFDIVDHTYPGVGSQNFVACNLFRSDNTRFTIKPEEDLSRLAHVDSNNNLTYRVRRSGLYKIKLYTHFEYLNQIQRYSTSSEDKTTYVTPYKYARYGLHRDFRNQASEIKLMRTSNAPYYLSKATMDNTYYRNNQKQTISSSDKKFPLGDKTNLSPNFIDPLQNPDFLCGFSFGRLTKDNKIANDGFANKVNEYYNPQEQNEPITTFALAPEGEEVIDTGLCYGSCPMAIKHGKTWDINAKDVPVIFSASQHKGYSDAANSLKVDLQNAPENYVKVDENKVKAEGNVSQVVWLNEGETLVLLATSDRAVNQDWIHQQVDFTLEIEPFSPNKQWIESKMHEDGYSISPLEWNDEAKFFLQSINLIEFLPSEIKIDDWLQNFCKAFNLELQHKGGTNFELNIKNKINQLSTSRVIDLDQKTAVQQGTNQSLALPYLYELGFTVDTAEKGYYDSMTNNVLNTGNTGGGSFYTGSHEANKVEQKSNFSYCWYIDIEDRVKNKTLSLPVITQHDVWDSSAKPQDNSSDKMFYNKAQRFWYKKDTHLITLYQSDPVDIALVSNEYEGSKKLILDYQNKPDSIAKTYFKLLDSNSSYTTVECYLSAQEYDQLAKYYVRYNGDLYTVVEADSYDPMGMNKTKLKLLKKK